MGLFSENYFETFEAQYRRYRWRRSKRLGRSFSFNIEPFSKKSQNDKVVAEIQKEIIEKSKLFKLKPLRGKIFLSLDLSSASKTPPFIHSAVKSIVDVCFKPINGLKTRKKYLIFKDDKQISYLHVRYFTGTDHPDITITAAPFGDFLQDLELFNKFPPSNNMEDDEDYELEYSRMHLIDMLKDKNRYIGLLGDKGYENMLDMSRQMVQEKTFKRGKAIFQFLPILYKEAGYLDTFPKSKNLHLQNLKSVLAQSNKNLAKFLKNSGFYIKLPKIPIQENETKLFKESVRKAFQERKAKDFLLNKIDTHIKLEVLYKPPIAHKDFSKDLDNIMRLIIPIFTEEFKPPAMHIDENVKSMPYGINSYEIFEIPRYQGEVEDGFIMLRLISGLFDLELTWELLESLIEEKAQERD